ncbi:MAG: hypothetical protein Q8N95_09530 [Desulfobacterales bacterium]|nr:hypothetical protein [Desulfobacterales bacterium]
MFHQGLCFGHVGEYGEKEDDEKSHEKLSERLAHDGLPDPEKGAKDNAQPYEIGNTVVRFDRSFGLGF